MFFQGYVFVALLTGVAGLVVGFYAAFKMGRKRKTVILSCLDSFRALGKLLVFKIVSREIVSVEEKPFEGLLGSILPEWIFTRKKIIMIFEFSMNFIYDLHDPLFSIAPGEDGDFSITLPVPTCDVALKDMSLYDEQKSRFLPILLPDIINGPLGRSFTVEEKNRLFSEAMKVVEDKAHILLSKYQDEVKASARRTLEGIARSFGARKVKIIFSDKEANIETRLGDKNEEGAVLSVAGR